MAITGLKARLLAETEEQLRLDVNYVQALAFRCFTKKRHIMKGFWTIYENPHFKRQCNKRSSCFEPNKTEKIILIVFDVV